MTWILLFFFALLLLFPGACLEGARNGLLLWFHTVLPTLFPFLFVSSMLLATGAAHTVSRILRPVLAPIFRVSTDACYAILIGLASGYPLGAKTSADLVQTGSISKQEGQYLLCFCNNASPMFILSFTGGSLLGLPYTSCLLLWLTILLSAFLTGALYRGFSLLFTRRSQESIPNAKRSQTNAQSNARLSSKPECSESAGHASLHAASIRPGLFPRPEPSTHPESSTKKNASAPLAAPVGTSSDMASSVSSAPPLEYALETAIQTITKVGGYIILFGILGYLITSLSLPVPLLQGLLAGILEITTGSSAIAALALPPALKTALICAVTAFGGLSSVLQTKSVLGSSGLSVTTYLFTKLLHALLAAMLSTLLLSINVL